MQDIGLDGLSAGRAFCVLHLRVHTSALEDPDACSGTLTMTFCRQPTVMGERSAVGVVGAKLFGEVGRGCPIDT